MATTTKNIRLSAELYRKLVTLASQDTRRPQEQIEYLCDEEMKRREASETHDGEPDTPPVRGDRP